MSDMATTLLITNGAIVCVGLVLAGIIYLLGRRMKRL